MGDSHPKSGWISSKNDSGKGQREQGISNQANRGIRTLTIEIARPWLRFQPGNKLSGWFMERFAQSTCKGCQDLTCETMSSTKFRKFLSSAISLSNLADDLLTAL